MDFTDTVRLVFVLGHKRKHLYLKLFRNDTAIIISSIYVYSIPSLIESDENLAPAINFVRYILVIFFFSLTMSNLYTLLRRPHSIDFFLLIIIVLTKLLD